MSPLLLDPEAYATHRAAVRSSGMVVAFMGLFLSSEPFPLTSGVTVARILVALLNVALLVALWTQRNHPRMRFCLIAFVLSTLPLLAAFWLGADAREALGFKWEPFLRHKLLFAIIALSAPPRIWIGSGMIAAFAVEASLEYWLGGFPGASLRLAYEPWATLGAAAIAEAALVARLRSRGRERSLLRELEELANAARDARIALAVLDLANTPLQTLEIRLALMEKEHPGDSSVAAMKRAVARLTELSSRLHGFRATAEVTLASEGEVTAASTSARSRAR